MGYFEEAGALWRTYVPPRGQADTVQGELIRSVEKLRDEAQRNGNINWRRDHAVLAEYLRTTLVDSGIFSPESCGQIEADVERLLDYERPETSDEPYDRLEARVVEWARVHPDPVPRTHNTQLRI
jgi:hypothetical protein